VAVLAAVFWAERWAAVLVDSVRAALAADLHGLAAVVAFPVEAPVTVGSANENLKIPAWVAKKVSEVELERLAKAIESTEHKTDAELVLVFCRQSLDWGGRLRRLNLALTPGTAVVDAVHHRAELEFHRRVKSKTAHQSGILIFISFFERRIVVLADQGVHAKLPKELWLELVQGMTAHLKKGQFAEGLILGFAQAAEILAAHILDQ
jgi:uncharacterized membrane protein